MAAGVTSRSLLTPPMKVLLGAGALTLWLRLMISTVPLHHGRVLIDCVLVKVNIAKSGVELNERSPVARQLEITRVGEGF